MQTVDCKGITMSHEMKKQRALTPAHLEMVLLRQRAGMIQSSPNLTACLASISFECVQDFTWPWLASSRGLRESLTCGVVLHQRKSPSFKLTGCLACTDPPPPPPPPLPLPTAVVSPVTDSLVWWLCHLCNLCFHSSLPCTVYIPQGPSCHLPAVQVSASVMRTALDHATMLLSVTSFMSRRQKDHLLLDKTCRAKVFFNMVVLSRSNGAYPMNAPILKNWFRPGM